jgi:hypothetical protein
MIKDIANIRAKSKSIDRISRTENYNPTITITEVIPIFTIRMSAVLAVC